MTPWASAWQQALYAEGGFYRSAPGPAGHFTTSCHGPLGPVFAQALGELARREGLPAIVDLGAGRGELLTALVASGVAGTSRIIGVDVVVPEDLPPDTQWRIGPGGGDVPDLSDVGPALVVANEWLDVVPCVVADADPDGMLREVLVDRAGGESPGGALTAEDLAWAHRWWPPPDAGQETKAPTATPVAAGWPPGTRVEIGRTRDEAYARLLAAGAPGSLVVAIDYGHLRAERPAGGTLTGYRQGHQVAPVPDGSCDLTAHVAMDSLGAHRLLTQRDALGELGLVGERTAYGQGRRDPRGYLAVLERNSAISALRGPGLGDFWWALTRVPRLPGARP